MNGLVIMVFVYTFICFQWAIFALRMDGAVYGKNKNHAGLVFLLNLLFCPICLFIAAVVLRLPEHGSWIACNDRLPGDMRSVLVVSENFKKVVMHRERGCWIFSGQTAYWEPTHWMPLPNDPEKRLGDVE